jgi:nitroreductase
MEVLEGIKTRQSYRAFKQNPILRSDLEKIVEAANNSPSYTNTQPWELAVVTGKKKADLAKQLIKLAKTDAPLSPDILKPAGWPPQMEARSREHGSRRLNTLGIERTDQEGREKLRLMNYQFYNAPCAVFLFMDGSLGEWSIFDTGLFTQNLILAAHSLGIGSCIQASVVDYAKEIKKFLDIDESKKMLVCIALGYPDPGARLNTYRSLKKKPEESMIWHE